MDQFPGPPPSLPRHDPGEETDTYDPAGQLTVRTFSDGSQVRYGYDSLGRRTDVTDTVGITRYTFDPAGRVTKVTHPDASIISFAYNPAGQRTQVTYPDLTRADYTYTPNSQISSTVVPGLGTATYVYDPDGRLSGETLPGGWSRTYTYTNGLLYGYVENRGAGGTTTTSLGRDPAGRVVVETTGAKTTRYGYDPAGQLTTVTDSAGVVTSYRYDLVGNRLTQTVGAAVTSYRYDLADQLLTTTAGAAVTKFTYDGAGRLLKEAGTNTRTYSYDKRGRPQALTVTIGATTRKTTFTYNPDDLLASVISVSGNTTTTQKLRWDPTSPIPQPLTIQVGTPTTRLVYGNERIAMAGTTTSPFSYDAYGSTLTTTATAAFTRTSTYSAFGAPISGVDNGKVRFAYRGELNIEDTLYLRARTYKPTLGRFTTKDPLTGTPGQVGPANPYPYGGNNPLNLADPLGLSPLADNELRMGSQCRRGVQVEQMASSAPWQRVPWCDQLRYPDDYHDLDLPGFPGIRAEVRQQIPIRETIQITYDFEVSPQFRRAYMANYVQVTDVDTGRVAHPDKRGTGTNQSNKAGWYNHGSVNSTSGGGRIEHFSVYQFRFTYLAHNGAVGGILTLGFLYHDMIFGGVSVTCRAR